MPFVVTVLLLASLSRQPDAQTRWPNEMWVNPGSGPGPTADLRVFFSGPTSEAYLGTLEDRVPVIDGPAFDDLFTRLDFRVTERLRGPSTVGARVSVMIRGGTLVRLSDGTFVGHGLAEGMASLVVGRTYFVSGFPQRDRVMSPGRATLIELTRENATVPEPYTYWLRAVLEKGHALLTASNPRRRFSHRAAFLAAIRDGLQTRGELAAPEGR